MNTINNIESLILLENKNVSKQKCIKTKIIESIFFDYIFESIHIQLSNDEKIIYNNILSNLKNNKNTNEIRTYLYNYLKKIKQIDINSIYNFYPISICNDCNTIKFFDLNFFEYYLFEVNCNQGYLGQELDFEIIDWFFSIPEFKITKQMFLFSCDFGFYNELSLSTRMVNAKKLKKNRIFPNIQLIQMICEYDNKYSYLCRDNICCPIYNGKILVNIDDDASISNIIVENNCIKYIPFKLTTQDIGDYLEKNKIYRPCTTKIFIQNKINIYKIFHKDHGGKLNECKICVKLLPNKNEIKLLEYFKDKKCFCFLKKGLEKKYNWKNLKDYPYNTYTAHCHSTINCVNNICDQCQDNNEILTNFQKLINVNIETCEQIFNSCCDDDTKW